MILAIFFIYKSPQYFLSSFESMVLSMQENRFKINFQDGYCCGDLVILIETILGMFGLQVTMMLSIKSIGLSVQETAVMEAIL